MREHLKQPQNGEKTTKKQQGTVIMWRSKGKYIVLALQFF